MTNWFHDTPGTSAGYRNSWWFEVTATTVCCRASRQHDHTPPSPPVSPQQTTTPRNWFSSFFSSLCLVEASSCSVLFFPLTVSFKAVRWQSTDSTDRKSIRSHPSRRSLSSYLDILTAQGGGRTQVCLFHTYIQKRTISPCFLKFISASATQKRSSGSADYFSFLLNGLMKQGQSETRSVLSHLIRQQSSPQRPNHNIHSGHPLRRTRQSRKLTKELHFWPDDSVLLFSVTKLSLVVLCLCAHHCSHIHWGWVGLQGPVTQRGWKRSN